VNFTPKTEQEIVDSKLWKKGEYEFEVVNGEDKKSKSSGKPMIELKIRISGGNGPARTITDYLLAETPEKLRHAASACGLLERYSTGSLSGVEFRGKRGRLKLGIEKDKKRVYPDKNVVLDYVCAETCQSGAGTASGGVTLRFD
jgi:hypothetical protein